MCLKNQKGRKTTNGDYFSTHFEKLNASLHKDENIKKFESCIFRLGYYVDKKFCYPTKNEAAFCQVK